MHQALAFDQIFAALVGMELIAIQEDRHRLQPCAHRPEYKIRSASKLHAILCTQINLRLKLIGQIANDQAIAVLAPYHILRHPYLLAAHRIRAGKARQRLGEAGFQLTVDPRVAAQ